MKTAEQQRKSDLAKIHLAKKQCGMQDIEYRTLVQAVSKGRTDSAGELDVRERGILLSRFRKLGFRSTRSKQNPRPGRDPAAKSPLAKTARAMWLWGADIGLVRDRSERALAAFCKAITGADDLAFTDAFAQSKAVEGIKAMLLRGLPDLCEGLYQQCCQHPRFADLDNQSRHALTNQYRLARNAHTYLPYRYLHQAAAATLTQLQEMETEHVQEHA